MSVSAVTATAVRVGDDALFASGWRTVLDAWEHYGFVHLVSHDATMLLRPDDFVWVSDWKRPARTAS